MQFCRPCCHLSASKLNFLHLTSSKRYLSNIFLSRKTILWTGTMQFCNPCCHVLAKNQNILGRVRKTNVKTFFFQTTQFFSQRSSVPVEHNFEKHGEKITPGSKKVSTRSLKNFTKSIFRKTFLCHESDHLDKKNAALTTLP